MCIWYSTLIVGFAVNVARATNQPPDSDDRGCLGCHRGMTNDGLWSAVSTPGTLSDDEHVELLNRLLKNYANSKK